MTTLSAKQAAEQVGMTKQAIINAIKDGRISASKDNKGRWEIEPSELFRSFSPINKIDTIKHHSSLQDRHLITKSNESDLHLEIVKLELESAKKEIINLKKQIDDLRDDRSEWRDQAKRLSLPSIEGGLFRPQKTSEKKMSLISYILGKDK